MPYTDFSLVYDRLMQDAEYSKRCNYILHLFEKYSQKPKLLLDLACGTGAFANRLALKGIEVIGTDMSEDMLSAARENAVECGADVLYLCQKAEELDLYGTVDSAICCLDSINHITNEKNLLKAFGRVSLFLEKGGLFVFDVNTEYKHRNVLGDNTFAFEQDGVFCVWKNTFYEKNCSTDITLDFFVDNGSSYDRLSESFCERAYSAEKLSGMLEKSGFEVTAVFDDMTENPPEPTSERLYFVAKKI